MFPEEDMPRPRRRLEPLPLYGLGVEELGSYIVELQAEIARTQDEITRKQGHKDAAAAFFKRPT